MGIKGLAKFNIRGSEGGICYLQCLDNDMRDARDSVVLTYVNLAANIRKAIRIERKRKKGENPEWKRGSKTALKMGSVYSKQMFSISTILKRKRKHLK